MVIIEISALTALIELYEDLAVIPGKRRDIGIIFLIPLKGYIVTFFFESGVGIVILMNKLNHPHRKLFTPFEIKGDLSADEVFGELRFIGGIYISLMFGAPVARCNMDPLATYFLQVVKQFNELNGDMLLSSVYRERMFKIPITIKERLIGFMEDRGIHARATAMEVSGCNRRNCPLKRGAPWIMGSGNRADFGQLPEMVCRLAGDWNCFCFFLGREVFFCAAAKHQKW